MPETPAGSPVAFIREKPIERKSGVAKSGFEPKELGKFAVNASLNCSVKCLYCSSDGVFCRSKTYRDNVGDWWQCDTFVPYGNIKEVVERDLSRLADAQGEVVMSTVVDPYQSRLVRCRTPRTILERLAATRLRLRVLTKMVAVVSDLKYGDVPGAVEILRRLG